MSDIRFKRDKEFIRKLKAKEEFIIPNHSNLDLTGAGLTVLEEIEVLCNALTTNKKVTTLNLSRELRFIKKEF